MADEAATQLPPPAGQDVPASINNLRQRTCLALARSFLKGPLKRFGFRAPAITRFDSMENYIEDRVADVSDYRSLFSRFAKFEGKTVLELGCNRGYLLHSFLQHEQFNAIGADLDTSALDLARQTYGDRIRFVQTTPTSIPVEDDSVDVIYTIDTVEHLSRPREIFEDAYRILKPGGVFLVHFHPWLGPYGSHLEDIIPFPWPHVLFSMDVLLDVSAALYDSPDYIPAWYHYDQNGQKRLHNFNDRKFWSEYLNHITIRQFKLLLKKLPFEIVHLEKIGFGGKTFKLASYFRKLAQAPLTDEFCTNAVFCVLRKPQ